MQSTTNHVPRQGPLFPNSYTARVSFGKSRVLSWNVKITHLDHGSMRVENIRPYGSWNDDLARKFYSDAQDENGDLFERLFIDHKESDNVSYDMLIRADGGPEKRLTVYVKEFNWSSNPEGSFVILNTMLEFRAYETIGVGYINTDVIQRIDFSA